MANLGTGRGKPGWDQPDEEWDRLFRLNFQASARLAQAAIPMLAEKGGCIVFVSSITGVEATPAPLPYSAAKAALINYAKNLSRQVAKMDIRVNCVAPGNILFPGGSWEQRLNADRPAVMQSIQSEVPMARFGTPEEIASLVAFLCSSRASFITGSVFCQPMGARTRRASDAEHVKLTFPSVFSLTGRVAVITGGAGFLGIKHAEIIAEAGGIPVLIDLPVARPDARAEAISNQYHVPTLGLAGDITVLADVEKIRDAILSRFERIDILINNAANNPKMERMEGKNFSRLEDFPIEIWEADLRVGLMGAFLCSRVFGTGDGSPRKRK